MTSDDGPPAFLNFRALLQARQAAALHKLRPAGAQLVLEHIAGATNGAPAFPGYEALAQATNLHLTQVREHIARLVATGYLTQTRRKSPNGGWGQPQWALGPLCQVSLERVSLDRHLKEQVPVDRQSSAHPSALASAGVPAQKRISDSTTVVQPRLVASAKEVVKREGEEKGTGAHAPKPPKQQRIADVCDAITALGLKAPSISLRDAQAVCGSDASATEIGEMWVAVVKGAFPATDRDRAFYRANLNLAFMVNHLNAYRERGNGRPATALDRYRRPTTQGGNHAPPAPVREP